MLSRELAAARAHARNAEFSAKSGRFRPDVRDNAHVVDAGEVRIGVGAAGGLSSLVMGYVRVSPGLRGGAPGMDEVPVRLGRDRRFAVELNRSAKGLQRMRIRRSETTVTRPARSMSAEIAPNRWVAA